MRLADRFEGKVQEAIGKLPILDIERRLIDYEIIPAVITIPPQGEMITTFIVALFMPSGPLDHVTHMAQADNPYCSQNVVDNLIRDLFEKVQKERDGNLGNPGLNGGRKPRG